MDRRKGSGSRDANGGGLAEATASRLRFEDADEVGMEVEVEDCPAAAAEEEVIGNDKTSADYYFDSYSHFGTAPYIRFVERVFFPYRGFLLARSLTSLWRARGVISSGCIHP
jgi:hypothetical protein